MCTSITWTGERGNDASGRGLGIGSLLSLLVKADLKGIELSEPSVAGVHVENIGLPLSGVHMSL